MRIWIIKYREKTGGKLQMFCGTRAASLNEAAELQEACNLILAVKLEKVPTTKKELIDWLNKNARLRTGGV